MEGICNVAEVIGNGALSPSSTVSSSRFVSFAASSNESGGGARSGWVLRHVSEHPDGEFIVATETGMLYPLQEAAPNAHLIEANRMAFCKYMKMITLPKLRDSLREMKFEVKVPPELAERATLPIERMATLARRLATHTRIPSRCWFGVWLGWRDHVEYTDLVRP